MTQDATFPTQGVSYEYWGVKEVSGIWRQERVDPMNQRDGKFVQQASGIFGLVVLVCGTALLVPSLRADDADAPQAARAVRLSNVDGEVHLSLGNQVLADTAVANTPLFEGTRIDTGAQGRSEEQFEDGSVARISPQSSLTLNVLRGLGVGDTRNAEIQLNGGL